MRELPDREHLLLPRDRAPVLYVSAQTWHCGICDPEDVKAVAVTTVVWLDINLGRCSTCGQKYELADALTSLHRNVPTLAEQGYTPDHGPP